MLPSWLLFLVSTAYVALLFAIAYYGDRTAGAIAGRTRKSWIYSLALGVYCTSWTFYGAVGRAAESGWDFLPIYLGPIFMFVFGIPLISRIIQISKRHNITSIADFIGARYGRHQPLAMLVTLIAVVGVLPYIALQLKAVSFSFQVLAGPTTPAHDNALLIAVLLAGFTILFGTRQVVSSESHHGMVLAIAFESVIKLAAFLAVGLYVSYEIYDGLGDAYEHALALPQISDTPTDGGWQIGFITQTLLAMCAIIALPRQFHVTVVEYTSPSELRNARWLFPVYLALISIFVLPIAAAGLQTLGAGAIADTFVLAVPMANNHPGLALFAYIGGFSAATSMVIVATIALSTMLCNEVVMPALLRWPRLGLERRQDLSGLLKLVRRIGIVGIISLAYLYYRLFTGPGTLTSIGLLSFSAVLQFAPAMIGGIYWRRGSRQGAMTGMVAGFVVWIYTLLIPNLLPAIGNTTWLEYGPYSIEWLRPHGLFGWNLFDPLTHGVLWSLAANISLYALVSLLGTHGLRERMQLARFLEGDVSPQASGSLVQNNATVGDLQELLERFFGRERTQDIVSQYSANLGRPLLLPGDRADSEFARHTEHLLAGTLGTSSARVVIASALRGRDMQLEDVIQLLDETSHVIHFNRELLRSTLEHLSQGVSVVDQDLRLVAWNQRYIDLFSYPAGMVDVGVPIEQLVRFNASRGLLGHGDAEAQVHRRLEHMRAGHAYTHQREFADGSVLEIRGNPMSGGGFVTTFSDVTAYKRSERQLQEANETLEARVAARTRELTIVNIELQEAKALAERANEAKTRFLAAASHDLVQPLNAARLFLSSINRAAVPEQATQLISQAEHSLGSAENLISGLLAISRLDARVQEVKLQHLDASCVLKPLAAEFSLIAKSRGIEFNSIPSNAVIYTDPALLRRILQNFLSNAVRYTRQGRVVMGCRRTSKGLRMEVWDTGPGIAQEQQQEVFEEFRRLAVKDAHGERGLGLGLAIADRIARVLCHELSLRSWPGQGSVFSVTVPWGNADMVTTPTPVPAPAANLSHLGAHVLYLENDPAALAGMRALLEGWACEVMSAHDLESARSHFIESNVIPDLLLVDYHLEHELDGVRAAQELEKLWQRKIPVIVITADLGETITAAADEKGYMSLNKPVRPAALRALMSRLMSMSATSE